MITLCRACGSSQLSTVVDLGEQRLSDFRADDQSPPAHPLRLMFCRACGLAQLSDTAPRDQLYTDGYGYYSGVNEGIRRDLQSVVTEALTWRPAAKHWLDIACNDGTLLSFVPRRIRRVGVDPVAKFRTLSAKHADMIHVGYFDPLMLTGAFDVITSVSVFYDLDDPGRFVDQVRSVLAPGGVWIIQQNYLLDMINNLSIDNICHEHVTYWSLAALTRLMALHGLRIIDVSLSPVNGGSFRTVVVRDDDPRGAHEAASVARQKIIEWNADLIYASTLVDFGRRAGLEIEKLRRLIRDVTVDGKTCAIYAASTRGATIWQAAGITRELCPYAVERNPDKVGLNYSALGIPIISERDARRRHPEYMLVGPWWFRDQIIEREKDYLRHGGRLIFPLPSVQMIGRGGRVTTLS